MRKVYSEDEDQLPLFLPLFRGARLALPDLTNCLISANVDSSVSFSFQC